MAIGDYIAEADDIVAGLENQLAAIEAGDLKVVRAQEAALRQILDDLQASARFTKVGNEYLLDIRSADTSQAIAMALNEMEEWRDETEVLLRADPATLSAIINQQMRLAEMTTILDDAAESWTRIISRLSDPSSFTPAQVAEAKQLSKDTAFYRRRFKNSRNYLDNQGASASFGKAENLAAETERVYRQARNFLVDWQAGTPTFRAGESTLGALRVARGTIRFNLNNVSLSSTAHARGLFSSALVAIAQPLGVCHFMFFLSKESRKSAKGFSYDHLYETRLGETGGGAVGIGQWQERVAAALGQTVEATRKQAETRVKRGGKEPTAANIRQALNRMLQDAEATQDWPVVWDGVNENRSGSTAWGTPITVHHNSREVYMPVPPTLLAEARNWAASIRSRRAA